CSTTYTPASPVSGATPPTSCTGAVDSNYTISYVNGTVPVTKPSESISWPVSTPINYGTSLAGELDATVSAGNANVPSTCTYMNGSTVLASTTVLPAGSYSLTVSCVPNDTTDYSTQTTTANLVVNPVPLVITASSTTVPYGSAIPTITPSYSGWVNNDSASKLTTAPTCSTTYTPASPVSGATPPTSCTGAVDSNYTISYVNGTVTVTKPSESISWPVSTPINYGTSLAGELDATVSAGNANVPSTCTYMNGSTVLASTTVLPAGSYSLTFSCDPTATTDYSTQTT